MLTDLFIDAALTQPTSVSPQEVAQPPETSPTSSDGTSIPLEDGRTAVNGEEEDATTEVSPVHVTPL